MPGFGRLDIVFIASLVSSVGILLLSLVGSYFDFNFIGLKHELPIAGFLARIPLNLLVMQHLESELGTIEASRFLINSTILFYVFLLSLVAIILLSLVDAHRMSMRSIDLNFFYIVLFLAICGVTLFLYPIQIWGENSLAVRLAVYSEFRYFLFGCVFVAVDLLALSIIVFCKKFVTN
jgi:hypothetical protein